MAFNLGKIALGTSAHKRYNHNLSFDNNTTFDFGSVQPLMAQYLMPNSDIKVSYKQLVRLSPLVAPSFARVHLQNEVSFVSIAEVVPYYEALLARMPYSVGNRSYKPEVLPYTSSATLVYLLWVVSGSSFTYWSLVSNTTDTFKPTNLDTSSIVAVYKKLAALLFGQYYTNTPVLSVSHQVYNTKVSECITFEGADYVVKFSDNTALTFRLNNLGRRLRKIFIGLGYSLNMSDNTPVSFVPLLAFYKAWFDLYAVQRDKTWLQTSCYSLIKYIEDNYKTNFMTSGFASDSNIPVMFLSLLTELSQCWYVYKDDFVSVHRVYPQNVARSMSFQNGHGVNRTISTSGIDSGSADPWLPVDTNGIFPVGLQALQRLSRFVNKDSLIGQRMSNWLRVHYGADVANSLFKDVNHVSSSRLDLQINDVFSTSDTAVTEGDNKGDGELLGAYAGKGIGFGDSGFKFHANTAGYIFVLSAIVPQGGYFQGNDTSLYALNNDTIPSADIDALGMEVTPKGAIASDNDIYIQTGTEALADKSFGYVPRLSGFKVKKNIVNGDMSRRGSIDSFAPYYLDRILTSSVIEMADITSSDVQVKITTRTTQLPVASDAWRYCARYPWLGNFNRIFYNSGTLYKGGDTNRNVDDEELIDDNFICQSLFDVSLTDSLKPISESYDTYEESTDNSKTDVIPE